MNPSDFLSGWKTIAAGVGLIGLGIYQVSIGQIETGMTTIMTGLAALGLRHAITKASK